MRLPILASRVFNQPILIHPGKAAAMLAAVGGHFVKGGMRVDNAAPLQHVAFSKNKPEAGEVGDPLGAIVTRDGVQRNVLFVKDGVAVIPIEGTLVHKGKWIGMDSGETSYEGLKTQIVQAFCRQDVRGVAFEIDSCGGEVSGCADTAEMILELSAEKPTLAILTDCAYSAAYYLASACRQIVMPADGGAGSIGAMSFHVDYSQALEDEGIKVTLLAAGKHKVDGNPYEKLPAAVSKKWIAELEGIRTRFAEFVGRGRGDRLTAAQALATEADCWDGEEAVARGLCDAVMRPTEAFVAFVSEVHRAARPNLSATNGATMSQSTGLAAVRAAANATADATDPAKTPAHVATVESVSKPDHDKAVATASATSAQAARERVAAIIDSEEAKDRGSLARHLAFKTEMSIDDAKATLAAAPKDAIAPAKQPNALEAAMAKLKNPEVGADNNPAGGATDDEKAAAEAKLIVTLVRGEQPKAA